MPRHGKPDTLPSILQRRNAHPEKREAAQRSRLPKWAKRWRTPVTTWPVRFSHLSIAQSSGVQISSTPVTRGNVSYDSEQHLIVGSDKTTTGLLIFAHVPPPFHGQSVMVQQMVNHLALDPSGARIRCWHVDARVSESIEDVGSARFSKIFTLLKHCREALRLQRRHQIGAVLIVPAPPKRGALMRDWIILTLLRRRFKRVIYYWQAAGLSSWLESEADPITRMISKQILGVPDLSVVLGSTLKDDAEFFRSRRIEVVPNFMPDPAPSNIDRVMADRRQRLESIQRSAKAAMSAHSSCQIMEVLFMSLCTRSKGLFDAMKGVALANRKLKQTDRALRLRLTVAGGFENEQEQFEFERCQKSDDLVHGEEALVVYQGFVHGEAKSRLFREADCICFPTYYPPEAFPTVLVESMAWGLPMVTTRWRAIPELLPEDYPHYVPLKSPECVCDQLVGLWATDLSSQLRERFLERYIDRKGLPQLETALATAWDS